MYRERMRSSGRRISRAVSNTVASKKQDDDSNGTKAALAGGAAGMLSGGVSNPTVTSCAPDDPTFYCKLTRFFNSTQMIINLIMILIAIIAVIYFGIKWFKSSRSQKGGMLIGAVKLRT